MSRLLSKAHWLLALTAILSVTVMSGCGFRLRGQSNMNIDSLYLTTPANSPLAFEIRRTLRANGVKVTDSDQTAQAILDIVSEKREEAVLTFTPSGTARELELRYQLQYRVRGASGEEWMPSRAMDLRRELLVTAGQVLPLESERQALYRDMISDAVAQIVRQLEYVRPPVAPVKPTTSEPAVPMQKRSADRGIKSDAKPADTLP